MSSNLLIVRRSHRGQEGHKLEINIPPQQIHANSKGGLINEGGVMSSEYGISKGKVGQEVTRWYFVDNQQTV